MKTKHIWSLLSLALVAWTLWQNLTVGLSHYTIQTKRLPANFDGYKIVQISDFHGANFPGKNQGLLDLVMRQKPDMIAITGDLVDGRRQETHSALALVNQLVHIAPTYYVTGNHEAGMPQVYEHLERQLVAMGVRVLRNEQVKLTKGNQTLQVLGLDDPDFIGGNSQQVLDKQLNRLGQTRDFRLVLSHRPEAFPTYVQHGLDLVLAGHVHGGQIRLPWLGGLIGPHQGWLPTYQSGRYQAEQTQMIVSRGLGNSLFPIRINNQPELVLITLKSQE